jgi:hypothetical protein
MPHGPGEVGREALDTRMTSDLELAEEVRAACVAAALAAYEDAGLQGLCPEGRWEAAVGAMKAMALEAVLQGLDHGRDPSA